MQTNGFGNSSYNDQAWSSARAAVDPPFVVSDLAAWRPVVVTTADRTVRITTTGVGVAYGVRGAFTTGEAAPTIALDRNTGTANRVDLLIARFDWAARSITFRSVSASAVVSTTTLVDNGITRVPGVRYDAVIGAVIVRPNVGPLSGPDLVDLRLWGGQGGPMVTAATEQYRSYLDAADGAEVLFTPTGRIYRKLGSSWQIVYSGGLIAVHSSPLLPLAASGLNGPRIRVWPPGEFVIGRLTVPDPGVPYRIKVHARGEMGTEDSNNNTRYDYILRRVGSDVLGAYHDLEAFSGIKFREVNSWCASNVITGSTTVELRAVRVYGSGYGGRTEFNHGIFAEVYTA